ncbi:MAG: resolvase [Cyanobacteriota bacterium]|nr:resolvase [Cyanobacteriota bacterium]
MSLRPEALIAGLDPGRSKCGLVLANPRDAWIMAAAILAPQESGMLLQRWQHQGLQRVVLGNGTGSGAWQSSLEDRGLRVLLAEERGSTLAARGRYWQLDGRRSWRRWLPAGLRLPPRDLDDVVAQLLLERMLGHPLERDGQLPVWRTLP